MVEFRSPEIEDFAWAKKALRSEGAAPSEKGFGTLFLWCHRYNTEIAPYKGTLLIRYREEKRNIYSLPFDSLPAGELAKVALEDAERDGKECVLGVFYRETVERLKREEPGLFTFYPVREAFDYIYTAEDLAYLKGRKYHGKRNHLSRFYKLYPDYSFHVLQKGDVAVVHQILSNWMSESESPEELREELLAIKKAMVYFDELELCGGYITVAGRPAAFVIGEYLNGETVDLHFEKALKDYEGLYAVINQEFAKYLLGKCKYINREEDMGLEGLRKSKESYYPAVLFEKYGAVLNGEI